MGKWRQVSAAEESKTRTRSLMEEAGRVQIMQSFVGLFEDFDPCSKTNNEPLKDLKE